MKPIRILVADDHRLFRAGIRCLLSSTLGMEVIAEAGNGREALDLVASHHPRVLLIGISMPVMNGLDVTRRVVKEFPDVRVVILSMYATERIVGEALRAGAAGCLLKDSTPAELEMAIRAVAGGENYLTPAVSRQVVAAYHHRPGAAPDPSEQLTLRQREVLQLIGEGNATKAIARRLNIGVRTVETHRSQLMGRLDVHNIAGLVRCAARAGLINLD